MESKLLTKGDLRLPWATGGPPPGCGGAHIVLFSLCLCIPVCPRRVDCIISHHTRLKNITKKIISKNERDSEMESRRGPPPFLFLFFSSPTKGTSVYSSIQTTAVSLYRSSPPRLPEACAARQPVWVILVGLAPITPWPLCCWCILL